MTKIYETKKLQGKKDDVRVLRSKRDLSNALVTLLETKDYSSISVKDICETALISKLCFYNNFLNKDDLMIYVFKKETDETLENIRINLTKSNKKELKYEDIITSLIHMYFDKGSIFNKIISQDKKKSLYSTIFKYLKETIPSLLSYNVNQHLDYIPNDVSLSFYASSLTGLLYMMTEESFLNEKSNYVDYIATLATSTLLSEPTIK